MIVTTGKDVQKFIEKGGECMLGLVILAIISVIVITLLSFLSKTIGKKILYPVAFVCISVLLFIIGIIVGGWEGMGIGTVSISLFVASTVSLIVIVCLYQLDIRSPNENC